MDQHHLCAEAQFFPLFLDENIFLQFIWENIWYSSGKLWNTIFHFIFLGLFCDTSSLYSLNHKTSKSFKSSHEYTNEWIVFKEAAWCFEEVLKTPKELLYSPTLGSIMHAHTVNGKWLFGLPRSVRGAGYKAQTISSVQMRTAFLTISLLQLHRTLKTLMMEDIYF